MAQDTSVELEEDALMNKRWSVPPYCHDVVGVPPGQKPPIERAFEDQSFPLTQGIVYQIKVTGKVLLQNVSENEDDDIEFSKHGDPCGVWNSLGVSNFIETNTDIFLYNRSHKQNAIIAVISE